MTSESITNAMEIVEDESFDFDGYQVVRGEFFAHIYEPSFTFNNYKCSVNTACIRKLPAFDYVQILVNPITKKLAVRPCNEEVKDSFRWCSATAKRTPKQITCRVFFAKVVSLMEWDPTHRYKLLGKLIKARDELLFVFDLNNPEVYKKNTSEDGKETTSRTPVYPEEWKNQFGIPVDEHRKAIQVNTFDGYAVFGLQADPPKSKVSTGADNNSVLDIKSLQAATPNPQMASATQISNESENHNEKPYHQLIFPGISYPKTGE